MAVSQSATSTPALANYSPFRKGGDKGLPPPKGALPSRLFCAVWSNDLETVTALVADPATNLNELTFQGNTPLHLAVS